VSDDHRAPGVTVVYQPNDRDRHFGPYLGGRQVRLAVSGLCRVFPLGYTGRGLAGTSHALAAVRGVTDGDRVTLAGRVAAVPGRDPAAVARLQASLTERRAAAAGNLAFELAAKLQQEIEAVDWVPPSRRSPARTRPTTRCAAGRAAPWCAWRCAAAGCPAGPSAPAASRPPAPAWPGPRPNGRRSPGATRS
jgi:excinuclease ABC subunit C